MRFTLEAPCRKMTWPVVTLGCGLLLAPRFASAADLSWKGYTWRVTVGGMAGVAEGSAANVAVDSDGNLHLKVQKNGDAWTAAEIFTTTRLGFGTYQWQIDGPIDTFDKNIVLGLFPYGPAANIGDDGTNEIDIEYSRWGQASGPNGDWTNYPASGKTIGELSYTFSLSGGTLSTSRFVWTQTSIEDFLIAGLEPISSTKSVLKSWKYAPDNPQTNIPQQALPLGMNLWCFAVPSDGKNVEIVVRDFQFLPAGSQTGGAAGAAGVAGADSAAGAAGTGGSVGTGGTGSASAGAFGVGGAVHGGTGASAAGASAAGANGGSAGQSNSTSTAGDGDSGGAAAANPRGESGSCQLGRSSSSPGSSLYWLYALAACARRRRKIRSIGGT